MLKSLHNSKGDLTMICYSGTENSGKLLNSRTGFGTKQKIDISNLNET